MSNGQALIEHRVRPYLAGAQACELIDNHRPGEKNTEHRNPPPNPRRDKQYPQRDKQFCLRCIRIFMFALHGSCFRNHLNKRLPLKIENRSYLMMLKIRYQGLRPFVLSHLSFIRTDGNDLKCHLSVERAGEQLSQRD